MPRRTKVKKIVQTDERGRVSLKPLARDNSLYIAEVSPDGIITLTPAELTPLAGATVRVHGAGRQVPPADGSA